MLHLIILCSTLFVFIHAGDVSGDLPSYLPRCFIDDPNMGNCIAAAANTLRSHIRKGIKEIGIPSYSPLVLPSFQFTQNSTLTNFTVTVWHYTIYGLDNYVIPEIQYDTKTLSFHGKIEFDSILVTTSLIINGDLVSVPVEGTGSASIGLGPINGTFEITGKMVKRRDIDYYSPSNIKFRLSIADMNSQFNDLFGGNKDLGTRTNEILNKNSKLFVQSVTPGIQTVGEAFAMRYLKWLTRRFPYHKLFPYSQRL